MVSALFCVVFNLSISQRSGYTENRESLGGETFGRGSIRVGNQPVGTLHAKRESLEPHLSLARPRRRRRPATDALLRELHYYRNRVGLLLQMKARCPVALQRGCNYVSGQLK